MNNNEIVRTVHGSRLFGCSTDSSDYDFKVVRGATFRDLVLRKDEIQNLKDYNSAGVKEETEIFTPHAFSHLLKKGQVVALEMLFTPDTHILKSTQDWEILRINYRKIVSKHMMPFIHYAKNQAQRYGVKGKKLGTLRNACAIIKGMLKTKTKMSPATFDNLFACLRHDEGVTMMTKREAGDTKIRYMGICGKFFSETTELDLWLAPLEQFKDEFGERSKAAFDADGVDLKAQYHCVRLCEEAKELWKTGKMTFPRPEAELLLKLRSGSIPKDVLETMITTAFQELDEVMKQPANIPDHPDEDWLDSWAIKTQRRVTMPEVVVFT